MPARRRDRLQPEWDPRWTRMLGLSAVVHVAIVAGLVLLAEGSGPRPAPLAAYTVEIADPDALGGRLPPGRPGRDLTGGATRPVPPKGEPAARGTEVARAEPPPEPKPEPAKVEPKPAPKPAPAKVEPKPEPPKVAEKKPEPPKAVEQKPEPAKVVEKKPEPPKAVEPKPEPAKVAEKKPEPPKAEEKKPEPPKAAEKKPEAAPEPAKAAEKKPEPSKATEQKPEPTKVAEKPAGDAARADAGAKPGAPAGDELDREYAALGDRWRERAQGGGLGGADAGSGPVGSGGGAGGGELVGLEFIAYRQQVIDAIKTRWTNVIVRPGLVATVHFEIDRDGAVTGIRLVQGSGNAAFDASAIRAVELASPLAPPPARYAEQFKDFQMEFHSEERGGGTG